MICIEDLEQGMKAHDYILHILDKHFSIGFKLNSQDKDVKDYSKLNYGIDAIQYKIHDPPLSK